MKLKHSIKQVMIINKMTTRDLIVTKIQMFEYEHNMSTEMEEKFRVKLSKIDDKIDAKMSILIGIADEAKAAKLHEKKKDKPENYINNLPPNVIRAVRDEVNIELLSLLKMVNLSVRQSLYHPAEYGEIVYTKEQYARHLLLEASSLGYL